MYWPLFLSFPNLTIPMIVLREDKEAACGKSITCDALQTIADDYHCVRASIDCQNFGALLPNETDRWLIPQAKFGGQAAPSVCARDNDRYLVAFPEPTESKHQQFVVATISHSRHDLVQRLVNVAWQNRQLRQQTAEQRILLDQYGDQVLHDFSEIDWMQKLVSQLKVCALSNSLYQTATGLLKPLQELVNAEITAFVSADSETDASVPEDSSQKFPGVWICEDTNLQPVTLSVVQRYRAVAETGVVVRNQQVAWPESSEFPEVSGFVLVAVQKHERVAGWIVALNKIHDCADNAQRPISFMSVDMKEAFSTAEAGLLASAASILATHDHNVRLLQGNIKLSLGIIRALTNAVDAKDEYTRGHSDRVARMAKYLGSVMKLSAGKCQRLLMTGLLHDIGKIGIADSVLHNPGRLSAEEFAVIQNHPVYGFNILQPVEELAFVLPGVLHHHEAWNGSGYPHGLTDSDIPLDARILAIVDTYDAMTSDRPYRSGMDFAQAEQLIRDGAGRFWDPELVDVFVKHATEFRRICEDARPGHDSFSIIDTKDIVTNKGMVNSVFDHGFSDWFRSPGADACSCANEPMETAGTIAVGNAGRTRKSGETLV